MKIANFKIYSFLFIFVFSTLLISFISSCKVAHTNLQVLQPADIMLPQHFQKFVLADRTRAIKGNGSQVIGVLEGLLTGEGLFQDKWGAEDCVEGLREVLTQTPRYAVAIAAIDTALKGTGRRQTLPPLDWATVSKLTGGDNETALIVLEAFDSNNNFFTDITQVTQRGPTGENIQVPQFNSQNRVDVYCVWRIYDLKNKSIVDQFSDESRQSYSGVGATQAVADANLPSRMSMTSRAGVAAGLKYGRRVSPQWLSVSRQYYKKGSDVLKSTADLVKHSNWQSATDAWDKESVSADPKAAMRASFNMALACEKAGQLDFAIQWANRAATMGDKRAMKYVFVLEQRKTDQKRLEEQMKGKKN